MAYFLVGYELELVDRKGAPLLKTPEPNYDTLTVVRESLQLRAWPHTARRYVLCKKLF